MKIHAKQADDPPVLTCDWNSTGAKYRIGVIFIKVWRNGARRILFKLPEHFQGKINPLIGSAGVSAVPMAARVSQKVGAEADPTNFLLMHAMGPNVAGVIGTAVAAGTFMAIFGV